MKRKTFGYFKNVLGAFVLLLTFSCNKEDVVIADTKESKIVSSMYHDVPAVSNTEQVGISNEDISKFIKDNASSLAGIDISNAKFYLIKFKGYPTLVGIHIKFDPLLSVTKDIFSVTERVSNNHLVVMREKIGFEKKGLNTGRIIFKSIEGAELSNDSIKNTFIIKSSLHTSLGYVNQQNNQIGFSIKSNKVWNCTETQFAAFYEEAKKTCANDWLCDFACTFNPCAISYIAYAVIKCSGIVNADNTLKI